MTHWKTEELIAPDASAVSVPATNPSCRESAPQTAAEICGEAMETIDLEGRALPGPERHGGRPYIRTV